MYTLYQHQESGFDNIPGYDSRILERATLEAAVTAAHEHFARAGLTLVDAEVDTDYDAWDAAVVTPAKKMFLFSIQPEE
ncbi:hypothetical protein [Breoghania corrubedonensis]|nr:hypothetical protein [Breoghania corrubedonensis]